MLCRITHIQNLLSLLLFSLLKYTDPFNSCEIHFDKMNFSGKICFVTGGSRGLGKAIVESFLQRKSKVFFGDVLIKEGKEVETEFGEKYGKENIKFGYLNVTSRENFEKAIEDCNETFGDYPDILINNAGVCNETSWENTIDVELFRKTCYH